jgi:hypothetical protein
MTMKRTLLISLLLLPLALAADETVRLQLSGRVNWTPVAAAECTETGAWTDGDTERFGSGVGAFCTTDWTETDGTSILNTYDSSQYVTGGHSMSVTQGATYENAFIHQTTGGTNFSFRFYLRVTGMSATAAQTWAAARIDNDEAFSGTQSLFVQLRRNTDITLRMSGSTASSAITLYADTWYRVEVSYGGASQTCTMGVYALGGSQVGSDVTCTSNATSPTYIAFGSCTGSSTGNTSVSMFMDNITFDASATFPIGADE